MLPPNITNNISSLFSEAHVFSQPLLDGLSTSPLTVPVSLVSALSLGYLANKIPVSRALNHGTKAYFDWDKEIVLVTGGSGGIGGETVQQLAEKGIRVVVLDVLALTYKARELPLLLGVRRGAHHQQHQMFTTINATLRITSNYRR
jgi:all-trans-retinol dehydrogenase (NAD+)